MTFEQNQEVQPNHKLYADLNLRLLLNMSENFTVQSILF